MFMFENVCNLVHVEVQMIPEPLQLTVWFELQPSIQHLYNFLPEEFYVVLHFHKLKRKQCIPHAKPNTVPSSGSKKGTGCTF